MKLGDFFKKYPKAALGFSGGVDSAYLLYAAVQQGAEIKPYFVNTAFQPTFELEDAQRLTNQLGIALTVIEHDILSNCGVVSNQASRCYHCKREIFGLLKERAAQDGFGVLLDGTNASDDVYDRPGFRALGELQVMSPLRICGLTKTEIRRRSKAAGLFTWNKPAYACLATRVPTGQRLTREILKQVEQAENELFRMGFADFRVRVFHDAARVQLLREQMPMAFEKREELLETLRPWFSTVLLDLKERD